MSRSFETFNSTVNEKITLFEKNLNQSVIAYQSECAKRHREAQDDIKRLITDLENAQSAGTKELKDSFAKDLLDAKEQMKSFVTVLTFNERVSKLEDELNKKISAAVNDINDVRT